MKIIWLFVLLQGTHKTFAIPKTCSDVKERKGITKDGHYTLSVQNRRGVAIYCHNMAGTPVEYLTLNERNIGSYPNKSRYGCLQSKETHAPAVAMPGVTEFHKLRVNVLTLEINATDYTFANVTGVPQPYGEAHDCYDVQGRTDSCDAKGHFVMDLSQTGFLIDPNTKWTPTDSSSRIQFHLTAKYYQRHHIGCGGYCGGCVPTTPLKLTFYHRRVDGGWSSWIEVMTGPCQGHCGTGVHMAGFKRKCTRPTPISNGSKCLGMDHRTSTEACDTGVKCPAQHGAWTQWTLNSTSLCSVSCEGSGVSNIYYRRSCSNPQPLQGGRNCSGSSLLTVTKLCNTTATRCPVHGGWSSWVEFDTPCRTSCGTSFKEVTMFRTCDEPKPVRGGRDCSGKSSKTTSKKCTVPTTCPPQNGGWSLWIKSSTGICSVTCKGIGMRDILFNRTCSNPPARFGGRRCSGNSTKKVRDRCDSSAIQCTVSREGWMSWEATFPERCSVTCDIGVQKVVYVRKCSNPLYLPVSIVCGGLAQRATTEKCNTNISCPVDGAWSSWTMYLRGTCSVSCGSGMLPLLLRRLCDKPRAEFGGKECAGIDLKTISEDCTADHPCLSEVYKFKITASFYAVVLVTVCAFLTPPVYIIYRKLTAKRRIPDDPRFRRRPTSASTISVRITDELRILAGEKGQASSSMISQYVTAREESSESEFVSEFGPSSDVRKEPKNVRIGSVT